MTDTNDTIIPIAITQDLTSLFIEGIMARAAIMIPLKLMTAFHMANENMNIIGAGQDTAHRAPKTNTIICGDCLEVMRSIPDKSVDMILCDLPYGTTQCKWDTIIPLAPMWFQYDRICRGAVVLTSSQPFTSLLVSSNVENFKYTWYWKKRPVNFLNAKRQPLRNIEDILVFNARQYFPQGLIPCHKVNKRSNSTETNGLHGLENISEFTNYPVQVLEYYGERGLHPTQKPVALFEYLIRTYTNEGDTVLDNCIGSGTTAIACINTNRNFIGIEKEEKYCRIAEERIHALRSPAQNAMEICHTAPNSAICKG